MKLSQVISGLLTATILLAMLACSAETDSDQIVPQGKDQIAQVQSLSDQTLQQKENQIAQVQPGSHV